MTRFLVLFFLILVVLFTFELTPPGQSLLVIPWTEMLAQFSAWTMKLFDPTVVSSGNLISNQESNFGVTIEAGCNAVEASIILIAAILAFPSSWRHKLWGLMAGILAVQAVNVLRIVSLFYLGQWRMDVFLFAHLYLWQGLIMLDVLIVWLVWMRSLPTPSSDHAFE